MDALSRRAHEGTQELAAVALARPTWLEAIRASYQQDAVAQQLMTRLALDSTSDPGFELSDGVIKFKGRIWIGGDSATQTTLISLLHDSAAGGHSGFHATYHRVRRLFAWRGLKEMVRTFVRQCQLSASKNRKGSSSWTSPTHADSQETLGSDLPGFHRGVAAIRRL